MKSLQIGKRDAEYAIIQGGMGVGVSRSGLAGAVAREGGVGVISTAQIGYDEPDFEHDQKGANLIAIRKHIRRAKEIADGHGLVGVNVMVALKDYREHVREAALAGADVIICGAGLPADLPELVMNLDNPPAIAPIVSSCRAMELILKMWDHHYHSTADMIVVEGPKAGGHLGFHADELEQIEQIPFTEEVKKIITGKKVYEDRYGKQIPVIVAGGIFDHKDIRSVMALGADGVQIASRFVATEECDASMAYKQAYLDAKETDVRIVKSPVGMPGRAIYNTFLQKLDKEREEISKCYGCLSKCNPATVPYCITKALTNAVRGDIDHGLIFCGANVGRIHQMTTVHELMKELCIDC